MYIYEKNYSTFPGIEQWYIRRKGCRLAFMRHSLSRIKKDLQISL